MRLTAVAGVGWLAAVSAACGEDRTHVPDALVADPAVRGDTDGVQADPDVAPPPPRTEPQLAAAELETVLATARPLVAGHDLAAALLELERCANKVPQSAECEALLAIALLDHRVRRAHAYYYLGEVVAKDHPDVSSDELRELAKLATRHGQFEDAEKAVAILEARGDADAEDVPGLARLM